MVVTATYLLAGIATILFSVIFKYFYDDRTRYFEYWATQKLRYVFPSFLFGSFKISEDLLENEMKCYKKFGRIYGRFDGSLPVLTVGERELINRIMFSDFNKFPNRRYMTLGDAIFDNTLFTLEGEAWKRVRHYVKMGFTPSNLKRMITLLQECCDDVVEKCTQIADKEGVVNCQEQFSVFVLHTIARCAFGVKINDDDPFIKNANYLFNESWKTILIVCAPALMKSCKVTLLNTKTTKFYSDVMSQVVEERKKITEKKFNDFLQRMLDCEDKEDSNNNKQAGLTHTEMLSQCVSFFLAGYESTTSFLSHIVYRLAMNQECQKKVVEEIRRIIPAKKDHNKDEAQNNEEMSVYLDKLKYLSAVMKECMRLCPPVARIERRAAEDYSFPEDGIHVKEGFLVSIPVYAMHHDPEYYPEPEVFNPDRFFGKDRKEFKNMFFPFGSGGRECVGKKFVIMQVKMCIVSLLMEFQILPAPTTPTNLRTIEMRNVLKVDSVDVMLKKWTSP